MSTERIEGRFVEVRGGLRVSACVFQAVLAVALATACSSDSASDSDDGVASNADSGAGGEGECRVDVPIDTSGMRGWYGTTIHLGKTLDESDGDFLDIELERFGVFEDGYVTGTFDLEAESDLRFCGICVHVVGDLLTPSTVQNLAAEAGTMEITAIEPRVGAPFQATITGLKLREISAGPGGEPVDVEGGCKVTIPEVTIDLVLTEPP